MAFKVRSLALALALHAGNAQAHGQQKIAFGGLNQDTTLPVRCRPTSWR
jgi:hypothetical protein